jgi:hypothetical protein
MSPSSSDPIASMTQTCTEYRLVATEHYTLLFPASSTWFSFSADFLYLDFGRSLHVMHYYPRHFNSSRPSSPHHPGNRKSSRYLCPKFNSQLAMKVKNLALDDAPYMTMLSWAGVAREVLSEILWGENICSSRSAV